MVEPTDSAGDCEAVEARWDQLAAERDAEMDAGPSLCLDAHVEIQRLLIRYGA